MAMKKDPGVEKKSLTLIIRKNIWEKWKILAIKEETTMSVVDFTEGAHPISTKGTIEISGAKRRSDL